VSKKKMLLTNFFLYKLKVKPKKVKKKKKRKWFIDVPIGFLIKLGCMPKSL
jgi:hypothetical protein